ncbi:MAG TPA: hypothetical protein VH482_20620 [Thermomicrobiales bacterium]|jgi:hypothetical protein
MANAAATHIRDRVAEIVGSDRRLAFLSRLAWELVIDVRAYYPAPDTDAYRTLGQFICLNELLHNLTSQLRSDLDHGRGGYPDRALVDGVFSKSRAWRCEDSAQQAFREAVASTTPDASSNGSAGPNAAASALLESDQRRVFLAEWFVHLTLSARAIRPPFDSELAPIVADFKCLNDLLYLVAEAIRRNVSEPATTTDGAGFVETLIAAANAGGCGGSLRYAFERTMAAGAVSA